MNSRQEFGDFLGKQIKRHEYEKYGHLVGKDKTKNFRYNLTHYGNSQVRFKKNNVVATWTYDDSLRKTYQPTMVSKPMVESFDDINENNISNILNSQKGEDFLYFQNRFSTNYYEVQYHGSLTIDDVESIVFPRKPDLILKSTTIKKLKEKGIELWWYDESKKEVVRY